MDKVGGTKNSFLFLEMSGTLVKTTQPDVDKPRKRKVRHQSDERTKDKLSLTKVHERDSIHKPREPTGETRLVHHIMDRVDYLEASTIDQTPLSVSQVETYFGRFGALVWCLQAGSNNTVIFKFVNMPANRLVLNYGHYIEKRPLALQAMKNGGVPVGVPSVAEAHLPSAKPNHETSTKTVSNKDTQMDMAKILSLPPEEFARYINSIH